MVKKIIHWISTAIMCGIFAFSASMYLTKPEMVQGFFSALDYPTYLVYPLATAKILGIIAVLTYNSGIMDKFAPSGTLRKWVRQTKFLKEWAYAGFFFDAMLATAAHQAAGHEISLSALAVIVTIISRATWTSADI